MSYSIHCVHHIHFPSLFFHSLSICLFLCHVLRLGRHSYCGSSSSDVLHTGCFLLGIGTAPAAPPAPHPAEPGSASVLSLHPLTCRKTTRLFPWRPLCQFAQYDARSLP